MPQALIMPLAGAFGKNDERGYTGKRAAEILKDAERAPAPAGASQVHSECSLLGSAMHVPARCFATERNRESIATWNSQLLFTGGRTAFEN